MSVEHAGTDLRSGKDRRGGLSRRHVKGGFFMLLKCFDRRDVVDRRGGLDRREELAKNFHKEMIVKIFKTSVIKKWDPEKAKMTYLWDKGLRAVSFKSFQTGQDVSVEIALPGVRNHLMLSGKITRTKKVFTERGFATEMDVQFFNIGEKEIVEINNLIWSDGEV